MGLQPSSSVAEAAERVRRACRAGMHIDQVERDIIAPARIACSAKGALWLLAFAQQDPEVQRQIVQEGLVFVREQTPALN